MTSNSKRFKNFKLDTDDCDEPNSGILQGNKCTKCLDSNVHRQNIVKCANCDKKFHNECLVRPICSVVTTALVETPNLWWICYCCQLHCTNNTENDNEVVDSEIRPQYQKLISIDDVNTNIESTFKLLEANLLLKINDLLQTFTSRVYNKDDSTVPFWSDSLPEYSKEQHHLVDPCNNRKRKVISPSHENSKNPIPKMICSETLAEEYVSQHNMTPPVSYAMMASSNNNKTKSMISSSNLKTKSSKIDLADKNIPNLPPFTDERLSSNPSFKYVPHNLEVQKTNNDIFANGKAFILILKPKSDTKKLNDNEWLELRKIISKMLPTTKIIFAKHFIHDGKIRIGFPTNDNRDKAKKVLSSIEDFGYEMLEPQKMLPKLTIFNVPHDIQDTYTADISEPVQKQKLLKQLFKQTILEKNEGIRTLVDQGKNIEVVFFQKHLKSYTVAIKVSPEIRSYIIDKCASKLFLFSACCRTIDRCYYHVCFHCQQIGHTSGEACPNKNKDPTCMYCAKSHRTKNCTVKNDPNHHCCANCLRSKVSAIQSEAYSHNANSFSCPISKQVVTNIARNTQFTSKNV